MTELELLTQKINEFNKQRIALIDEIMSLHGEECTEDEIIEYIEGNGDVSNDVIDNIVYHVVSEWQIARDYRYLEIVASCNELLKKNWLLYESGDTEAKSGFEELVKDLNQLMKHIRKDIKKSEETLKECDDIISACNRFLT